MLLRTVTLLFLSSLSLTLLLCLCICLCTFTFTVEIQQRFGVYITDVVGDWGWQREKENWERLREPKTATFAIHAHKALLKGSGGIWNKAGLTEWRHFIFPARARRQRKWPQPFKGPPFPPQPQRDKSALRSTGLTGALPRQTTTLNCGR